MQRYLPGIKGGQQGRQQFVILIGNCPIAGIEQYPPQAGYSVLTLRCGVDERIERGFGHARPPGVVVDDLEQHRSELHQGLAVAEDAQQEVSCRLMVRVSARVVEYISDNRRHVRSGQRRKGGDIDAVVRHFPAQRCQQRPLVVHGETVQVAIQPDARGVAADQVRACRRTEHRQPGRQTPKYRHHHAIPGRDQLNNTAGRKSIFNEAG